MFYLFFDCPVDFNAYPLQRVSAIFNLTIEMPGLIQTQKQPTKGVLRKRCSENMQQIYRRTPMSKCDSSKVALQFVASVNSTIFLST